MPTGPDGVWLAANAQRSRLEAIARRRGLGEQEAQDVASETILRAACAPDLDLERAGAWMSVVAQRLSADVHRRRPTQALLARVHHLEVTQADELGAVDDRFEAAWVASVVATLPEAQRDILQRVADGAGAGAVAQSTGRTYKSVESCLSRARRQVRHALEATLGVLAVLAGGARPRLRLAAPTVTVAAACLAVAVHVGRPPADTEVEAEEPPAARSHVVQTAVRAAPPVRHHPTPAPVRRAVAPAVVAPAPAPAQALGPVEASGVTVERKRGDESLVESVLWCLSEGLTISPERVGCPEPDALSP